MTIAEILAAASGAAGNTNTSGMPYVYPKDLTAKPFTITDITECKGGYRNGKDVVRFMIKHKSGETAVLDMSKTKQNLALLEMREAVVKATGYMVTHKAETKSGTGRWDIVVAK